MERDTPLDCLIDSYLSGSATPQERKQLERAYQRAVQRTPPRTAEDERLAGEMDRIGRDVWLSLMDRIPAPRIRRFRRWRPAMVAAALVAALLSVGIWLYVNRQTPQAAHLSVFANDIAPGAPGATLTLSNGQRIALDEAATGEVAHEQGVIVRKSDDGLLTYEATSVSAAGMWNTLSTDSGQTYRVRLPDGSLVHLNAASSLEYPASWAHEGQRRVRLTGEGYFEVARDVQWPFIVEAAGQEVEVLGTRFNISGYTDEPAVETVLLEGSIRLSANGSQEVLQPGQQARNAGGHIRISQANAEQAIDWVSDEFALNGLDFRAAMRKIARWYQVDVVYDASVPDDLIAGGWISRNTRLSDVLRLIERAGQVYFRVEGRTVYVVKQGS
ncbi:FecR family protein [Parapedobacter composti]|nr:FecR family protein [Parapedobacter composti]